MRRLTLLPALAAAVLLAAGCGSDDGGSSTSASTTTPMTHAEVAAVLRQKRREARSGEAASHPTPENGTAARESHEDSGGGVGQFITRGADNSIQEFGAEASDAERERAAEVLHAYLDARAAQQWATACSYVSSVLAGSLGQLASGSGCAGGLAAVSERVPDSALAAVAIADVGSLRSNGSRGFILYHGANKTDYAMPMTLEDGSWKVSAIEGSGLL